MFTILRFVALVSCSLAGVVLFGQGSGDPSRGPYLIVLGISQDGGVPQVGTKEHPGWHDETFRRRPVCLGIVDEQSRERWIVDATPSFPEQLHMLDDGAPVESTPGLAGVFLTHAHMGHYTGLMYLGHEALGAEAVPVYVMPKMFEFLSTNGPWDQLIRYRNIELRRLRDKVAVELDSRLSVTPFLVPHRQEYSEVIGFRVQGPTRSVLFIPDIDSWKDWDGWGTRIEDEIRKVDVAYLDGTFYADGEIPGRDMSTFPHPFITRSMERFRELPQKERAKVRFIHLNHTNPALRTDSEARRNITEMGFRIAEEGERVIL